MNEFKESCHEGEASGHMVKFVPKETSLLFAAGIYSDWVNPATGEILSTFAMILTDQCLKIELRCFSINSKMVF